MSARSHVYNAIHPRIRSILLESGLPALQIWEHKNLAVPIRSPADFANAIGYAPSRIVKTIIVEAKGATVKVDDRAGNKQVGAVALSASSRMRLSLIAREFGWKACEVAKPEMLALVTDFPPGGICPLGLEPIPLIVDVALMGLETVIVGAGAIGVEIEIPPQVLVGLTLARIVPVASSDRIGI